MTNSATALLAALFERSAWNMPKRTTRLSPAELLRMYEAMAVPRIDLLLTNPSGKVLLVDRSEEPHAALWMPGECYYSNADPVVAALECVRSELGIALEGGTARLLEFGTYHYQWGMPSCGFDARLVGLVWHAVLESIEVSGLQIDTEHDRMSWHDPAAMVESRGAYHPTLVTIAGRLLELR